MNPCVKEITKRDPNVKCSYCHRSEINSLEWGPMYQLAGISVHYFCMLFSAGLSQHGDDDEGILGFLPKDIRKELKRGEKLKCKFCRCVGATIGCSTKSCKTSYHYPCGLEKNSVFQFIGNFESYCEKHREKFNIPYADIDNKCPICYEEVYATDIPLWPPCCKKRIFHKNCIMEMAKNHAAHFFKCPLCNDKDIFSVAMRKSGVYLPDRDATWELEPNAFAEHTEVYSRCDADICRCPKGREYSSSSDSKPYKIVRCGACAAAAVHTRCGNLKNLTWRCQTCADILSDKRKSENLNSSRIQRQRYDTSEDEDASDTEEVLKLRDVISTVPRVQPQPVNDRIIIERSLFEENYGSRCVVDRAETDDSDSEDDNDEDYFISSRSRTFASKLRDKDIENFVSAAEQGFILIAFGSSVDFSSIPAAIESAFFDAIGRFPKIHFLVKASSQAPSHCPKNLMFKPWAPQKELMAHPKTLASITHGGLNGIIEATWTGVPLITIPIFAEQDYQSYKLQAREVGIRLELRDINADDLAAAISDITTNPMYRNNMKKLQVVFRDRPQSPVDLAAYWTEFTLRHDDLSFMNPITYQPWKVYLESWLFTPVVPWVVLLTTVAVIILTISILRNKGKKVPK
ncbi:unnamed protein product [Orchesella dallaii]|uniref:Glucuronosyltransferase n=1 Tax=Orchesella dallaii TaxID=48710 RepID=A0ABP1Q9J7_9HEXA